MIPDDFRYPFAFAVYHAGACDYLYLGISERECSTYISVLPVDIRRDCEILRLVPDVSNEEDR